jgi:hypothetical protein
MSLSFHAKDDRFLIVLSVTFILGLAVGLALCGLWRYHPQMITGQVRFAAIALCPPFLLAGVLDATTDSTLALIITIGCIAFASGFLYAGLASFGYFLMTTFLRRAR